MCGLCRSKDHNKDVALGGMNEGNVQRFNHCTLLLLVLCPPAVPWPLPFGLVLPLDWVGLDWVGLGATGRSRVLYKMWADTTVTRRAYAKTLIILNDVGKEVLPNIELRETEPNGKKQLFGRAIKKIQIIKESSVSLFYTASNLLP